METNWDESSLGRKLPASSSPSSPYLQLYNSSPLHYLLEATQAEGHAIHPVHEHPPTGTPSPAQPSTSSYIQAGKKPMPSTVTPLPNPNTSTPSMNNWKLTDNQHIRSSFPFPILLPVTSVSSAAGHYCFTAPRPVRKRTNDQRPGKRRMQTRSKHDTV